MRLVLSCCLALVCALPATACLNDSGTERTERRFRDSYGDPDAPRANALTAREAGAGLGLVLLGTLGLVLGGGALALVLGSRRRAPGRGGRRLARRVARGTTPPPVAPGRPFSPPRL